MTRVLLTEKRDQAEKLSAAMGWRRGQGCFEGDFQGEPIKVVWARGHLVTLKSPNEVRESLNSWDDPKALLPIPRDFELKVGDDIPNAPAAAQPRNYLMNIKKQMKGCSEFIIATDSDREGEAIGWLVLDYLNYKGPVRRAWFAAGLDKKSLQESMGSLRDPSVTKSWFRASESRARSDWAYMLLVRAYTYYASYGLFGSHLGRGRGREGVMSVGRVQTPALGMIVRRDLEIENFVAQDHFRIAGKFGFEGADEPLSAEYHPKITREIIDSAPQGVTWDMPRQTPKDGEDLLERPLFTDRATVDAFGKRLTDAASSARVSKFYEKEKRDAPPKTFSLTDAQSAVASACRISANLAQVVMEDLYEQGWTSYARTSKSDLPMNFYEPSERNSLLNSVSLLPELSTAANHAMDIHNGKDSKYKPFTPAVFTTKNLEHHGIVPTHQEMTPAALSSLSPLKRDDRGGVKHTAEHMRTAYILVAKQFIQAMLPPTRYKGQEIGITVPVTDMVGHPETYFRATGRVLIDAGWRAAFNVGLDNYVGVPSVAKGLAALLQSLDITSAKTQPPKRFTEITLPKAMENVGRDVSDPKLRKLLKDSEGIGTPATRKSVIDTLTARGYVEVTKGAFISTPKGREVITSVPDWMASPEQTALWEDYLIKICNEKDDTKALSMRDEFVEKQFARLEKLINTMNVDLLPKATDKVNTGPGKITTKMKNAIRSIADKKGISIPKGTLSDPVKASEFLNEHLGQRKEGDDTPSENQLKFAESLAKNLPDGVTPPDDYKTNRKACSDFIEMAKQYSKPSEKQIALAKKLIEELPEGSTAPDNVLTSADACSAFISARIGKGGKSSGKKKPGKGAPRRAKRPAKK